MSLLKHKNCPDHYKFVVFGYVRENTTQIIHTIPSILSYLCLAYYFHGEYFEKCGNLLKISQDRLTVRKHKIGNTKNGVFGKTWIESQWKYIAKWHLKINYCHKLHPHTYDATTILLLSSDFVQIATDKLNRLGIGIPHFQLTCDGYITNALWSKLDSPHSLFYKDKRLKYQTDDVVKLTLNIVEMSLTVQINDKEEVKFDDISKGIGQGWKIGIVLLNYNDSVTLQAFECIDTKS